MTNAVDAYLEHAHRVALLMSWLEAALERHDERAADRFSDHGAIWPMVGNLERVEAELKEALSFIAAVQEDEIDNALNRKGQGNE